MSSAQRPSVRRANQAVGRSVNRACIPDTEKTSLFFEKQPADHFGREHPGPSPAGADSEGHPVARVRFLVGTPLPFVPLAARLRSQEHAPGARSAAGQDASFVDADSGSPVVSPESDTGGPRRADMPVAAPGEPQHEPSVSSAETEDPFGLSLFDLPSPVSAKTADREDSATPRTAAAPGSAAVRAGDFDFPDFDFPATIHAKTKTTVELDLNELPPFPGGEGAESTDSSDKKDDETPAPPGNSGDNTRLGRHDGVSGRDVGRFAAMCVRYTDGLSSLLNPVAFFFRNADMLLSAVTILTVPSLLFLVILYSVPGMPVSVTGVPSASDWKMLVSLWLFSFFCWTGLVLSAKKVLAFFLKTRRPGRPAVID